MKKIMWVFDFDDTLIKTSKERIKNFCLYQIVELDVRRVKEKTMSFFKELRDGSNGDVSVITARHPLYKDLIQEYLQVDDVYCRNYCLTAEETKTAFEDQKDRREFLQEMIDYKSEILNDFADKHDIVIFIDDYANEFNQQNILKPNVYAILPFDFINGKGNTIDGAINYHKKRGVFKDNN